MLELGKPGSGGAGRGVLPVLRDGAAVAILRASSWRDAATAVVGEREWVFAKHRGELTARLSAEPEGAARMRARKTSFWSNSWALDLDGTAVEMRTASLWRGTHKYLVNDRVVAESGSTGGWSPRPRLTAERVLTLDQQVFLLWIELVISRRNSAAATAGVSAAVIAGGT